MRRQLQPKGVQTMSFNETANRDAKILAWEQAVKALAAAKDAEAALRKEVLAEAFAFDPEALREGTENFELGNGYKLKAVFKISRTMNNADDAVDKVLTKIEKTGPEGQFIAERLVKWKPELSVSEYKKLPEKFKKLIDEVVVSKEAMPTLELVAPKSK
jgi:hypothetical protein